MTDSSVLIRRATRDDLPHLGRLGAQLMRVHYRFDTRRFLEPGGDAEEGYAWFLGTQLDLPDALVLVAVEGGAIVGYAYAAIEPRSWQMLLDEAGVIHDVLVEERACGHGIATALVRAALDWISSRGIPRVVLHTADRNERAQRLFTRLGFRRTMVEMTLSRDEPETLR
jgi:ribosomal protein S18 acetylase RimI-like enzyme